MIDDRPADDDGTYGTPKVFVGGSFDPARSGEPWRGWPAAWAFVPRRLVEVEPDGRASALVILPPRADPDAEVERLRSDLAAARVAPAAARVEQPVAGEDLPAWTARVGAALATLAAGRADKLVLARALERRLERGAWDVARTLERLGAADDRAVRFAVAPGGGARGCFVGATPELLVRARGRVVETAALAGTCARGADAREDERLAARLLASDKDRREHALVVDAVRDALAPSCESLAVPTAPSVRPLRHVQHLETRLRGALRRPGGVLDLAARLHPTPAVAGAPREASLAWLREHEPLSRGWYAGVVGWLDAEGGGELAVAIRSALLDGPRAWTFAGAGIVAGSDAGAEWDETRWKLETLERALCATT